MYGLFWLPLQLDAFGIAWMDQQCLMLWFRNLTRLMWYSPWKTIAARHRSVVLGVENMCTALTGSEVAGCQMVPASTWLW